MTIKVNNFETFLEDIKANAPLYNFLKSKNNDFLKPYRNLGAEFEEVYISFNKVDRYPYQTLLVTPLSDIDFKKDDSEIEKVINGLEIGEILDYKSAGKPLYMCLLEGVLICSPSKANIQEILKKNRSITTNPVLEKLYENSGNNTLASLFINTKLHNPILSKPMSELNVGREFTDWIVLDTEISPDYVALTGLSISESGTRNVINLFNENSSTKNQLPYLASKSTGKFSSYTFGEIGKMFAVRTALSQYESRGDARIYEHYFSGVTEVGVIEVNGSKAIALYASNPESLDENIRRESFESFNFGKTRIRLLKKTNILNQALKPFVGTFNASYCCLIDNALVFSNNIETLKLLIRDFDSENTLYKQPQFEGLEDYIFEDVSVFKYARSRDKTLYGALQFIVKDNSIFVNAVFRGSASRNIAAEDEPEPSNKPEQAIGKQATLPKTTITLDDPAATNPTFLVDHSTKKLYIAVQDNKNKMYAINGNGTPLWKRVLDSKVLGKIHQIDILKNSKLQMAFVTNHRFFVIDRNGNSVNGFEKVFSKTIDLPLAVFDYDKTKDYRFFIASGSELFVYDHKGLRVEGFGYKPESDIRHAPEHFKIGDKDYIVITERDGSLKILQRNGKPRIQLDRGFAFSNNPVYMIDDLFSVTDKNGNLIQIDKNGQIRTTSLGLKPDHLTDATPKRLVSISENMLTMDKKRVFLSNKTYLRPQIFYINNKIYIAATTLDDNMCYLFDSNLRPLKGFPVAVESAVDMGDVYNNGKVYLIGKGKDNTLVMYRVE